MPDPEGEIIAGPAPASGEFQLPTGSGWSCQLPRTPVGSRRRLQLLSPLKKSEDNGVPGWPRTPWGGGFRAGTASVTPHTGRSCAFHPQTPPTSAFRSAGGNEDVRMSQSKCLKDENGPTKGYAPIVAPGPWLLLRANNPLGKKLPSHSSSRSSQLLCSQGQGEGRVCNFQRSSPPRPSSNTGRCPLTILPHQKSQLSPRSLKLSQGGWNYRLTTPKAFPRCQSVPTQQQHQVQAWLRAE